MLDIKKLKAISELDGIPGNEKEVSTYLKNNLEGVVDEITFGNIGELITKIDGKSTRKVMIAAHMDEVGFVVSRIDDNGFIFMTPAGGWVSQVMLAQKFTITTDDGKKIRAISGSKPPHIMSLEERKEPVQLEDIYLDLGVCSKEEVLDLGIQLGDMITPYTEFEVLNNSDYLLSKAWDDRIGCAIMASVMEGLNKSNLDFTVYGVGTVQEEVGLRGAKTSAYNIAPDIAIALDTSIATDTPGIDDKKKNNKLGAGPLLFVMDRSMIAHKGFFRYAKKIAKENNIDVQFEFLTGGGQDGGEISLSRSGVPTINISLATRYIHSHAGIISKQDYENAVKLIIKIIESLNEDTFNEIKQG